MMQSWLKFAKSIVLKKLFYLWKQFGRWFSFFASGFFLKKTDRVCFLLYWKLMDLLREIKSYLNIIFKRFELKT